MDTKVEDSIYCMICRNLLEIQSVDEDYPSELLQASEGDKSSDNLEEDDIEVFDWENNQELLCAAETAAEEYLSHTPKITVTIIDDMKTASK